MFDKIILCETSNKLIAGLWQLGKLQSHQTFKNDEKGLADFSLFLTKHPNIKLYFLVDAVEEDYRLETLPHTSGGARREVLERKLSQIYRGVTYRAAHFIGREEDKRKDDRFQFVALNSSDLIQPWIDIIEKQQAPLAGVYLLPMVSQSLVRRMKLTAPHILLSERLSSGLRQSYLHNGRLRISRLTPVPPVAQSELGHFYITETEKTRLYLISQRYIGSDTQLSMVLPSLDESSESICRAIEQNERIKCTSLDLARFARGLKLQPQLLQKTPELLHMQLLAMGKLPDNLAPTPLVKYHQLNLVRQLINRATIIIVSVGLVWAGIYIKQSFDDDASTDRAKAATSNQERLYRAVARNFPTTTIPSNDLKLAVELQQAIAGYVKSPKRMMETISKALELQSEIQINRLHWVLTNAADPLDDDKTQSGPLPKQVSGISTPLGFVPDPKILYEVAFINGEIKGFNGDYRVALESVNHFAERLKADASVEGVTILQGPVNVSSFSSLQGSTAEENTSQQSTALFKLRVRLKPPVTQSQALPL